MPAPNPTKNKTCVGGVVHLAKQNTQSQNSETFTLTFDTRQVGAETTVSFPISIDKIVSVRVKYTEAGGKITPTGVIDPTNVSTGEANLINGNLTDLTYNNQSQGTNNKELPAIDLGTSQALSLVKVYWWNNTYTANNYKIQGSNNGTTWTDLATGQNSSGIVNTANNPQEISVTGSYRYIRVFCVSGNNASWCVVSELEAYGVGGTIVEKLNASEVSVLAAANSTIEITNDTTTDYEVTVVYYGE